MVLLTTKKLAEVKQQLIAPFLTIVQNHANSGNSDFSDHISNNSDFSDFLIISNFLNYLNIEVGSHENWKCRENQKNPDVWKKSIS